MKRIKTQILSAAEWLAEGKALTPIEALNLFGSMRLSSIIHDCRRLSMICENTERSSKQKRSRGKTVPVMPVTLLREKTSAVSSERCGF